MQAKHHIAPHTQRIIEEAVSLYCDFINQYIEKEPATPNWTPTLYTPEAFQPTPEADYRYTRLIADTPGDQYNCERVITVALHDGDEGGPHMLLITTDAITNDPPTINTIMQHFDTSACIIYSDHKLTTDEDRTPATR